MVPPSYVDITTALYSRGLVNVIGVVVDVFGDVFKTGGTSLCITFTVKDTNLDNGHSWDGLKVKYFNDKRASLPPVKVNDVVILQNLQVGLYVYLLYAYLALTLCSGKDIQWENGGSCFPA